MKRIWRTLKLKPGLPLILAALVAFGGGCAGVKPSRTIVQPAPDAVVREGTESRVAHGVESVQAPAGAPRVPQASESEAPVVQGTAQASDAGVTDTGKTSVAEKVVVEGESNPPALIAKSENAVTQAERDALYKTLGFELDALIQLLDRLDNVQESDLNLDEFEE